MKLKYFLFVFFIGMVCSCSVPKNVTYFQGIDSLTEQQLDSMSQNYTSKICPDDRLSITVPNQKNRYTPTTVKHFGYSASS